MQSALFFYNINHVNWTNSVRTFKIYTIAIIYLIIIMKSTIIFINKKSTQRKSHVHLSVQCNNRSPDKRNRCRRRHQPDRLTITTWRCHLLWLLCWISQFFFVWSSWQSDKLHSSQRHLNHSQFNTDQSSIKSFITIPPFY